MLVGTEPPGVKLLSMGCAAFCSTLQHELANRDMELSRKNLLIQQLMLARQQQQVQQQAYHEDG